jgi:polyhydroxybutyrate depolymerase
MNAKDMGGSGGGAANTPTGSGGTGGTASMAHGAGSGGAAPAGSGGGAAPPPTRHDAGTHAAADDDSGIDLSDAMAHGGGGAHATGPGDWKAGDYPPDIMSDNWLEISGLKGQNGYTRQYKVHVPPGYDPNVPTPLVFCIHGLGQDALMFCVTGSAMDKKSDEAGFIMVMPNGYNNSWNGGACCGDASNEKLDDVGLFRAIFAEVGNHVNVDLDRVYATGLSNGGFMSYRLACEAADIVTAVAPGAGAIGTNDLAASFASSGSALGATNASSDFTTCAPKRPVSVLDMHGTDDPLVPYSLQKQSLDHMAAQNGCAMTTKPAEQPKSGGDTTCVSYDGCPSGIVLTGCTVQGGGHCWFGSPDCGTAGGDIGLAIVGNNSDTLKDTDSAWEFFKDKTR